MGRDVRQRSSLAPNRPLLAYRPGHVIKLSIFTLKIVQS